MDGTTFIMLSEYGYRYQQMIPEEPLVVTVPSPCVEGKWWFWFNKDGYRGINAIEVVWGDPLEITLQPKDKNARLPEVAVKGTYMMVETDS